MDNARNHIASLRLLVLALGVALALVGGTAVAQDLQSELSEKQTKLEQKQDQKGVLSSEIANFSDQINQLAGEVAVLRNREAIVAAELRRTEERLDAEVQHLRELKDRLGRSLNVLRHRLVEIYKSDEPDALTVILSADGFDDLVNRYDYLTRIQDQDSDIVDRVRDLRNESKETVLRVRAARDEIRAKKEELERTRIQLEAREAELSDLRGQKAAALDEVESDIDHIHDDIGEIQNQIQSQLADAGASTTESDPLPAGPVQDAGGGFIWPVNGTFTSPFGYRWGRLHAGIDIAVAEGTPIRATKGGNVVLAAYTGGYGNYTCVDHGGGLSSCYAHQSGYAASVGQSVGQGEVIGYSGNTGSSTGPHLHFEIRVNGTPVDPMGYL